MNKLLTMAFVATLLISIAAPAADPIKGRFSSRVRPSIATWAGLLEPTPCARRWQIARHQLFLPALTLLGFLMELTAPIPASPSLPILTCCLMEPRSLKIIPI